MCKKWFFSVTEEHSEFSVKVQLFWKEDICQNCVISYNFKTEIWLRVDYVLQKRGLEPVFPTFPITMKLNIPKLKKAIFEHCFQKSGFNEKQFSNKLRIKALVGWSTKKILETYFLIFTIKRFLIFNWNIAFKLATLFLIQQTLLEEITGIYEQLTPLLFHFTEKPAQFLKSDNSLHK